MNKTNCLQQRTIRSLFRDYNSQKTKQTQFTNMLSDISEKKYNHIPDILDDFITIPYLDNEIGKWENETSDPSLRTVIVVSTRSNKVCVPLMENYCRSYSSKTELIIVGMEGNGKWNKWRQMLNSRRVCGTYVSAAPSITKQDLLEKICTCTEENQKCYDNICNVGPIPTTVQDSLTPPVFVSSLLAAFLFGIVLTIAFKYLRGCCSNWTNNTRNQKAYSETKPSFVNETYAEDNVLWGAAADEFYETIKDIPVLPPRPTMKSETKNNKRKNDLEQSVISVKMKTDEENSCTNRTISLELRDRKIHADIENDQRCTSECPCIKSNTDDSLDDHEYFVLKAEV